MANTDSILRAIAEETQKKLPLDERMAEPGQRLCLRMWEKLRCTRAEGHEGGHVAHSMLGDVVARCPQEAS